MNKLFAIGVGPGSGDLLTVRAAALLRRLEVVAYPHPALARKIAAPYLREGALQVPLRLPLRKKDAERRAIYEKNAERLVELLNRGKDVGFLCEGDPLLYGSFIPLLRLLEGRVAIEVVPGINSFTAAAAHHKTPLASGLQSLLITPNDNRKADELLRLADNAVVLKPVGKPPEALRAFVTKTYGTGYFSLILARKG